MILTSYLKWKKFAFIYELAFCLVLLIKLVLRCCEKVRGRHIHIGEMVIRISIKFNQRYRDIEVVLCVCSFVVFWIKYNAEIILSNVYTQENMEIGK